MGKGGRPDKLTPERVEELLKLIRVGVPYITACRSVGITYRSFRNYVLRGRAARRGKFFQFFQSVQQAEADAEAAAIVNWRAAIPNDWRAADKFLSKRWPQRWGEKQTIEHSGKDGGVIPFTIESAVPRPERPTSEVGG